MITPEKEYAEALIQVWEADEYKWNRYIIPPIVWDLKSGRYPPSPAQTYQIITYNPAANIIIRS